MLLDENSGSSHVSYAGMIFLCFLLTVTVCSLTLLIYRLFFHSLCHYPGSLLARATNLYAVYHAWKGDKHLDKYRQHEKYGDFVRIQPNLILINRNSAIKEIHGSQKVQKGFLYRVIQARSGALNTFNSIDKTIHGHKRRALAPCFSDHTLRDKEDSILPLIRSFLAIVSGGGDDASPWEGDMAQWSTYLAFDIMSRVSFGKDFEMLSKPDVRDVPKLIESAGLNQLMTGSSLFVFKWGLDRLFAPTQIASGAKLLSFVRAQVEERKNGQFDDTVFLDLLMKAKENDGSPTYPDEKNMAAEARSLVVAGSDTTGMQLAANFFYLTTNPSAQRTVAAEVRSTFASVEDIRHGPALDSCRHLKAFIEETLRMAPSVPGMLPREVLPGGITVAGKFFPTGVELAVPIYALHHSEKYHPEPHQHRPERWLPEAVGQEAVDRAWSAFSPFSYGSRSCLGKKLAYMELWTTIARVVWTFDLEYRGGGREEAFGDNVVEYRLLDHLTAGKSGPIVRFHKRVEA